MPHTRSAKKNLRKSETRRLRNRSAKKAIKTQIKKVLATAEEGPLEALQQEFGVAGQSTHQLARGRELGPQWLDHLGHASHCPGRPWLKACFVAALSCLVRDRLRRRGRAGRAAAGRQRVELCGARPVGGPFAPH